MVEQATSPYPPDPRLEQAGAAIAGQLGISPADVAVRVEHGPDGNKDFKQGNAEDTSRLIVTVHKQGLDLDPGVTENIRTDLSQLKPLADYAQMTPQEQLTLKLRDDIIKATENTNFDKKLLEWPGFKPDVISNGWEISDYTAQNVQSSAFGVKMNLHFPQSPGENQTAAVERFSEITKGRLPAIKEILTERVLKYARANMIERGLNVQETQLANAEAQQRGMDPNELLTAFLAAKIAKTEAELGNAMERLQIAVNTNHNNIVVTLRSPEQEAAFQKAGAPWHEERDQYQNPLENADTLRASNPLTSTVVALTTQSTPATETTPEKQPQLNKALARSLLFDKEKHLAPDAIQILGRGDFKAAFIKEAVLRVLPQHPEKKEELMAIIDSDLFKNHGAWHNVPGKAGMAKREPVFHNMPNDTVEIAFTLGVDKDSEKNQLLQVVNGLASATPVKVAATGAATVATAAASSSLSQDSDASNAKAATLFVYHGTSHTITGDSLIPSGRSPIRHGGSHTPVVYANSNPRGAYAYALRTDDTLITDAVGDQPYIIIKDKEKFEREFKGGTIYKYPSALFESSTPKTGASSIDEWTSRNPVPLAAAAETIKVPDVKTAIRDGGIKVYYTDPAQAKHVGEAVNAAMQQDGPNHTEARTNLLNQLLSTGVLTSAEAKQADVNSAPAAKDANDTLPVAQKTAPQSETHAEATAATDEIPRKHGFIERGLKFIGMAFAVAAIFAVGAAGGLPLAGVLLAAAAGSYGLGKFKESVDNAQEAPPAASLASARSARNSSAESPQPMQERRDGKSWVEATAAVQEPAAGLTATAAVRS